MILYYAIGGGLGHLTRGRRVLETLGLAGDAAFVTASPYAADARVTGGIPVIDVPRDLERDVDAHREWLRGVARGAERLIVDTFPCGIQGELGELPVPIDLVARRLRWDVYRRAVPAALPRFESVWCVEDLSPDQEAALRERSERILPLVLHPAASAGVLEGDYWLVVHSGPEGEVRELVAYADELRRAAAIPPDRVLVATRCAVPLPDGFTAIDAYPAAPLFPGAACIISAAGFNVMLETEPWREKHVVVPFGRTFDDQFARAGLRRAAPTRPRS